MKIFAFFVVITTIICGGCSVNVNKQREFNYEISTMAEWEGKRPLKEIAEQNTERANRFALDLFRTAFNSRGENICISPVSVLNVFAMMANGDDGDTRNEILRALGYGKGDDALNDLNVYCNALLAEATSYEGLTKCEFTNSIWYDPTLPIMPEFASAIQNIFNGKLFPIWLGNEAGKNAVNKFVKEHTYGLIPQILQRPLVEDRLEFLNTTYFNGIWQHRFNPSHSYEAVFHNADGTESMTTFMKMDTDLRFFTYRGIQGVVLPYGGGRYAMTVIQPSSSSDFNSMLDSLDSSVLTSLKAYTWTREVHLHLPRFKTEINVDMNPYLRELGFEKVFYPGISKASDHYLSLTKLIHAVCIIVDEKGTEAAAASIASEADGPSHPQEMNFNRPFVYMIRDTISDTILFIGAVTSFLPHPG